MQRLIFEHGDITLKLFRFLIALNELMGRGLDRDDALLSPRLPYFGGLTTVFSCDYLQLVAIITSSRLEITNPDESVYVVPVQLLDELPWRSNV